MVDEQVIGIIAMMRAKVNNPVRVIKALSQRSRTR